MLTYLVEDHQDKSDPKKLDWLLMKKFRLERVCECGFDKLRMDFISQSFT